MTDENRVDMEKARALLKNRINGRMPEPAGDPVKGVLVQPLE